MAKVIYRLLILFIVIICSFSSFCLASDSQLNIEYSAEKGNFFIPFGMDYTNVLVKRVVDGDTIVLGSGQRLRLIGIDTPEMHHSKKLFDDSRRLKKDAAAIKAMGRLSYKFARKLMEGKRVSLEFDVQERDKYGRLLAYVYLEDGTFVNAKIVEEGYASLMTIPPNIKYADLFVKLHREARQAKRGLWAE